MKYIRLIVLFSLFISCASKSISKKNESFKKELIVENQIDKAFDLFAENKLEESLNVFEKIDLKGLENAYEIQNYIGVIHLRKNRYDLAKEHFDKALRLKSDYADAYNNLGLVYLVKGRYELALSEFQTCLHYNPRHEKALKNRKLVDDVLNKKISLKTIELFGKARNQGNLDEKIKAYQDILEKRPNLKEAKNNLAVCYYYKGERKKAQAILKDLLKTNFDYHEAHNNYAFTLIDDGNTDLAKRHYLTSIKLKASYTIAMINLGDLYFKLKDYSKAERLWRTVLKVEPQNSLAIEKLDNLNRALN